MYKINGESVVEYAKRKNYQFAIEGDCRPISRLSDKYKGFPKLILAKYEDSRNSDIFDSYSESELSFRTITSGQNGSSSVHEGYNIGKSNERIAFNGALPIFNRQYTISKRIDDSSFYDIRISFNSDLTKLILNDSEKPEQDIILCDFSTPIKESKFQFIVEMQGQGGDGAGGTAIKSGAGGGSGAYAINKIYKISDLNFTFTKDYVRWNGPSVDGRQTYCKCESGKPATGETPGEFGKCTSVLYIKPYDTGGSLYVERNYEPINLTYENGYTGGWRNSITSRKIYPANGCYLNRDAIYKDVYYGLGSVGTRHEKYDITTYFTYKRGGYTSNPSTLFSGNGAPSACGNGGDGVGSGKNGLDATGYGAGGGGGASKAFASTVGGKGGPAMIRIWWFDPNYNKVDYPDVDSPWEETINVMSEDILDVAENNILIEEAENG